MRKPSERNSLNDLMVSGAVVVIALLSVCVLMYMSVSKSFDSSCKIAKGKEICKI